MSNTLKFGNGVWATKKGSTLAYNDENGNFKPLPFNFERAGTATRVNKEGLIEVVGNNEPRIDFKDSSEGALLLEPTRSNLVTYSEAFDNASWNNPSTVTANTKISPSGLQNADTVTSTLYKFISATNGLDYTVSAFVKKELSSQFVLRLDLNTPNACSFDLDTLTAGSGGKIEDYGNNWYRCSFTATATVTATGVFYLLVTSPSIYIWGAQVEQGSYATSYIPTSGGAVTRVADVCNQTPPSGIIGQTEGTMFLNIKRGVQINNTQGLFGISSPSGDNRIIIWNIFTLNSLGIQIKANNANVITSQSLGVFNNGENYKIAVSYKSGEIKGYVNGLQIFNLTNTFTFTSALSEIYLNNYANNSFTEISPINELQIYNTALTDLKLQQLTTL